MNFDRAVIFMVREFSYSIIFLRELASIISDLNASANSPMGHFTPTMAFDTDMSFLQALMMPCRDAALMAALVAVGIPMVSIPRPLLEKLLEHSLPSEPLKLLSPTYVREFILQYSERTKTACR